MRRMIVAAIAALILGSGGEARSFSTEALRLVDESVTFVELSAHPENYRDKYVLLGGTIVRHETVAGGSRLEVAELPLDSRRKPDDSFSAGGHFVAASRDILPSARYRPGTLVTVIGRVAGTAPVVVDEEGYSAPVVAVREMRTWVEYGADRGYGDDDAEESYDYRPRYRSYYYYYPYDPYYPYYYPYYYSPYYYPWYGPSFSFRFDSGRRHFFSPSPGFRRDGVRRFDGQHRPGPFRRR